MTTAGKLTMGVFRTAFVTICHHLSLARARDRTQNALSSYLPPFFSPRTRK
jgi:hypothetical protein